jgi:4-alpha-glucanotransferase
VAGWYRDPGGEASVRSSSQIAAERAHALRYLDPSNQPFHWKMIRAAMASVARFAIFPLQDVLGLGSSARMNRPGTTNGNWEWRVRTLPPDAGKRLAALTETFGRMETTG